MEEPQAGLARQPILAADGTLHAYELLHRGPPGDERDAGTARSARVLCETLGIAGLGRIAGDARIFLNFDQDLLETDLPTILVPNRSVVEVLESVEPRPRVFETLDQLRRRAIGIAIDDFVFQDNLVPFLPYADYVKVDVLAAADELEAIVDRLEPYDLQLLAEKVETHEQHARCKALGFDYFQGYYFARPEPMPHRHVGATEFSVLTLMARLENPDVTAGQLTDVISVDAALVHQILRLANSGTFYRGRALSTIHEAVVMLGQYTIRQWASLLLLTRLGLHKPPELLKVAVTRARLCQTLGAAHPEFEPQELFTAGLLSILDALFDRPMDAIVADLPLSTRLRDVLCGRPAGPIGEILARAIAYGSGDWMSAGEGSASAFETYLDAVEFADQALCH